MIAQIMVNRGISTPEEAFIFLNPSFQYLTDPSRLKDMDNAVKRIYSALMNREKILIFGDYDADGITATAILYEFLSYAGADVSWYIPHRVKEGYGLKPVHIGIAARQRCDLIITVDCGSDSHEAAVAASREDIDIIITDHHEIQTPFPGVSAIINPKREDCTSGLEHLAGVGVAFYLVIALRQFLRSRGFWENISEPNLTDYCDLFAIGTIADMVPLIGENRILSKAGVGTMKRGDRAGLRALVRCSGIDPDYVNPDDISYRIAPRINAAGRISHARICVDLLTEKDRFKAEQSAYILDELNRKRQDIERAIFEQIDKKIELDKRLLSGSAIIMSDPSWNPGVIGIVASKVAAKYSRPTVLISTSKNGGNKKNMTRDSGGASDFSNDPDQVICVGSCRSSGAINIHDAILKCSDLLDNFGGHSMAAGFTIKAGNIDDFSLRFERYIASASSGEDFISELNIDAEITFGEITEKFVGELDLLKPFGSGNPEPLFLSRNVDVISSFMIGSRHRKMVLSQINRPQNMKYSDCPEKETESADCLAFNGIDSSPGSGCPVMVDAIFFNIESGSPEEANVRFSEVVFRINSNGKYKKAKSGITSGITIEQWR